MNALPTSTSYMLFAVGLLGAFFVMKSFSVEGSAFRRASRASAALAIVTLGSLPASSGSEWQASASIALGIFAAVLEGVASVQTRRAITN